MNTVEMPDEDNCAGTSNMTCKIQPKKSEAVSGAIDANTIPGHDSIISLGYLERCATSSENLDESEKPKLDLRVEVYKPKMQHFEIIAPPTVHHSIIEESQAEFLPAAVNIAVIEEPKIEILPPIQSCAIVERRKVGVLRTYDGDEIIILSCDDDDDDDDENNNKLSRDVYESADDSTLQPIDAQICSCLKRDSETQTIKRKRSTLARERLRRNSPSEGQSSEQLPQKSKANFPPQNAFRQRQLELHRHRISVEKKRLELLELKLQRERDEMLRDQMLFEKELELKTAKFRALTEDRLDQ